MQVKYFLGLELGFDGTKESIHFSNVVTALIGVICSIFVVIISIGCCFVLYKRSKKTRKKKMKRMNFNKNSKQLQKKLITSHGDTIERTKIIPLKELEKATNNFDKTRIIGQGGHGTVYKGLLSDQRVTAIKTSNVTNPTEVDEFINEVALLSRIYHRNVVMLYGCCLETEVPILVYEFVSNGTLSDHLHARDHFSHLCWDDRLRIAIELSSAILYLHFASSKTIFHSDLKSANILLDEKLSAKLSDFGASKYVGLDQTHITSTTVQGTIGYLDPEYYQSGKLTEKSDVYSLGVILVELFTGQKPISNARTQEERNIIMYFIKMFNEKHVELIFDTCLEEEADKDEIEVFARLACSCLRYKGEERPTMKEVVSTLEGIVRSKVPTISQNYQKMRGKKVRSFDDISTSSWTAIGQQNSTHEEL